MTPFLQEGEAKSSSQNSCSQRISFIYQSKAVHEVMQTVNQVAPTHHPVAIIGNRGSGKNLLATQIHEKSSMRFGSLLTLHCKSLSEKVLYTELFGFKGNESCSSSEGALRKADGGTLILDDVSTMPLSVQESLYHFIQTGEVKPSGSSYPVSVNVRLILTLNKEDQSSSNQLVKTLFHCVNPCVIQIPSLCDRKEDIPDLVRYFSDQLSAKFLENKKVSIPDAIMSVLKTYHWPQNVRELKNVVSRLISLSKDHEITVHDLPSYILNNDSQMMGLKYDPSTTLSEINRLYILASLKHFSSKKKAAQALGITVKTLYNRLHEYGVFDQYAIHSKQS